jgi:2-polyprenyl-3-methyl-5-hydroxy-6-metoxy-1,4-benzoquinol methylase
MSWSDYHQSLWEAVPEGLGPSDFRLRRRFLLEHVRAGERVLDLGCGEGAFTAELARAGVHALGVDVAQEPLRRARTRHPELELALVDGEGPWELADASFDAVWAGEVIEHVRDTGAWLSELRRVLRSGGRLLLSTPAHQPLALLALALSSRAFATHFDPRGDHLRFYNASSLSELLTDFGFEQLQVRSVAGLPGARRILLVKAIRSRY